MLKWFFTIAFLFCLLAAVPAQGLVIGNKIHEYSVKLTQDPGALIDQRMHQHEFPCVKLSTIEKSDIPRTDFVLKQNDGKILLGIKDEVLLWKGIDGKDPFLNVPDKYLQFRGGVPIFNFSDPQSFDFKDEFNLYIEYKAERLPEDLQSWAAANNCEKLKVKSTVVYETNFLEVLYTREDKSKPSVKLQRKIFFNVVSVQGKVAGEWVDFQLADHQLLQSYFQDLKITDVRISDEENPLGKIVFQESPEMELRFSSNNSLLQIPVCEPGLSQVYVYPNPSFGNLNLSMIDLKEGKYTLDIYNLVGYKMWSQAITLDRPKSLFDFDLSFLETGIYVYGLKDERGTYVQTRRLVILEH